MDELKAAIRTALQSSDSINRDRVGDWIRAAPDVESLALLYRLTDEAWDRITPILENPDESIALPRQEAARELEVWFDHLSNKKNTQKILKDVVAAVTELFLKSEEQVRCAIETGFLEHVLEQTGLRPLFSHWAHDERLRETWQRALAWGEAHPDYMKGLREQLRALQ